MQATLPSPTAEPAPETHAPHACLNCGTALHDQFCARCSQPAATHRITLAHWLHEIPHSIWHVDKGLLYTLRETVLRPGPSLRGYLAGQRVRHFRPLSYVLLITGIVALLYAALHLRPYDATAPGMPEATHLMQERLLSQFTKYLSWFTILMLPLTGALVRLFLRPGGFNYAESISLNAFITGTSNVLSFGFLPMLYFVNGTARGQQLMMVASLLTIGYQTWAYGDLLNHTRLSSLRRYLRGALLAVLSNLVVVCTAVLLLFMLNWSLFVSAVQATNRQMIQQRAAQQHPAAH